MAKNYSKVTTYLSALLLALGVTACGSSDTTDSTDTTDTTDTTATIELPFESTVKINGAGASFPNPLYQNWFSQLATVAPKLQVNYQSVGSGSGVKQFTAGTVDFGASDVAMKDEEIQAVDKGVLLLPMTAGSIVFAYNLPGVEGLKLSREAYVDIAMGKITKWNDPKIVAENPDLNLPDKAITFVHRSDGSGTTGVLIKHLSAISPEWKDSIGEGKNVQWPTDKGQFLGGKGNEGITALLKQNEGAIGYVEFGYAKNNGLSMATLENKVGQFITPSDESASKTLENVPLPENLRAFITDPEQEDCYPIVTYTWILAYKEYDDPNKAIAVEAMIQYGLTEGQKAAPQLGYIRLPENVIQKVAEVADQITPDYTIKVN